MDEEPQLVWLVEWQKHNVTQTDRKKNRHNERQNERQNVKWYSKTENEDDMRKEVEENRRTKTLLNRNLKERGLKIFSDHLSPKWAKSAEQR